MTNIDEIMNNFYRFLEEKYRKLGPEDYETVLIEPKGFIQLLEEKYNLLSHRIAFYTMAAAEHIFQGKTYHRAKELWNYNEFPNIRFNGLSLIGTLHPLEDYTISIILEYDYKDFLLKNEGLLNREKLINSIDFSKHELHSIEELD
jgi:hypothetical protein